MCQISDLVELKIQYEKTHNNMTCNCMAGVVS